MEAVPSLDALHRERQRLLYECVLRQEKPRHQLRQYVEERRAEFRLLAGLSLAGLVAYFSFSLLHTELKEVLRLAAWSTVAVCLGLIVLFSLLTLCEPAWSRVRRQAVQKYQAAAVLLAACHTCGPEHCETLRRHVSAAQAALTHLAQALA